MSQHYFPDQSNRCVIQTQCEKWVIPENGELLKLLISQQNLNANDLKFSSVEHSQWFAKRLFLLALRDERKHLKASPLTNFARDLAFNNQTLNELL